MKKNFDLSTKDYEQLLKTQGGGCAICGGTTKGKSLAVDHDHKTGKIRGLLCTKCNTAIGVLGDTVRGLTRALNYLRRFKS